MLPITQGVKTSEFWLSLVAVALSAVAPMIHPGSLASQIVTVVSVVLVSLGYTAHRSNVKATAMTSPYGMNEEDDK